MAQLHPPFHDDFCVFTYNQTTNDLYEFPPCDEL